MYSRLYFRKAIYATYSWCLMNYINILALWMELLLRSAWKLKDTHTSKNKTKQRDSDDEEEIKKTDQESDSG